MKAATTVLFLVLSAAVGSAFADDGGGTAPPNRKAVNRTPTTVTVKHTAPATVAKPIRRSR